MELMFTPLLESDYILLRDSNITILINTKLPIGTLNDFSVIWREEGIWRIQEQKLKATGCNVLLKNDCPAANAPLKQVRYNLQTVVEHCCRPYNAL